MTFAGRVALVTGSTRGIGWATARLLAERGATVVVNGRSEPDVLDARVAELQAIYDAPHTALPFDVADARAVQDAMRSIFSEHRRLDLLVNNAGILRDALLGMAEASLISETFGVNAIGTLNTMQAAARLLARGDGGAIVNVASIIATHGNAGQVAYGGSKAAVVGMTLSAAKELAPQGIRVNAVAPGYIDTEMIRHLSAEVHAERVASIAMGRVGEPQDIARAIAFLGSAEAGYITGQVLGVDGGMVI